VGIRTDLEELPDALDEDRGVIMIETNGGRAEIDTRIRTESRSVLAEPEPVVLKRDADGTVQGRLVLRNEGMATAHVEITASGPQVAISRGTVEVKPGKSVRVSVSLQGPAEEGMALDVVSANERWRVPIVDQ
jgi:hypothetical protein